MTIDEAAKVLGVDANAGKREVKKAFHKLAHEHHPDKGGDQDAFVLINRAYQMLLHFGVPSAYTEKPMDTKKYREDRDDEDEMEETIIGPKITIERGDGTVDVIPRGPDSFQNQRRRELDAEYKRRRRPKELNTTAP